MSVATAVAWVLAPELIVPPLPGDVIATDGAPSTETVEGDDATTLPTLS